MQLKAMILPDQELCDISSLDQGQIRILLTILIGIMRLKRQDMNFVDKSQ